MKKLNPERRCLLILSIFNFTILLVFIPISAVFNLWGLTIGWSIGTLVTFISMALIFKSGNLISSSALDTGKGTGLAVAFYLLRFILLGGSMITCAILHYKFNIDAFTYSLFTCAASALPSALIITIFYKHDDEPKKVEKNNEGNSK